jgi:ABC-type antimicrobial peptide transport system permease subunit
MLKNFLTIAVRNLWRNKGFSIINISGLAIGMASALLILLWVQDEWGYDRMYANTNRLYHLYIRDSIDGQLVAGNNTPAVMAPVLRKEYAGVEDVARFNESGFLLSAGETHLNSRGAFADSGFLTMFGFPMLQGDPALALSGPYNIVLAQSQAQRLFGKDEPMGRTLRIDSSADFTVTGILKDLPDNTDFRFDYLLPWSYQARLGWDDPGWGDNYIDTYVLLRPGVSPASFDAQIDNIVSTHSRATTHVFTQPMSRMHLYSKSENGRLVGDRILTVRLFAVIAGFIMLIACINFMNLSTARSMKRAREVGIRKVAGARKGYLVMQFIGESLLIAGLSFLIALLIIRLSLPAFNQLVGKKLAIDGHDPRYWMFAAGFVLFTGLLAGSYPAFYLSSFKPVQVLKSSLQKADALISTRKGLVVLQFSFAIMLVICTLIIERQIRYGLHRDAGYNRTNLVYMDMQGEVSGHYDIIKQELLGSGAAVAVTRSPWSITNHWNDAAGFAWEGSTQQDQQLDFTQFGADADFVKTTGVALTQGRDIDIVQYPTDSSAILVNEAAVKAMRLKDPVGQILKRGNERLHVVGVIRDFILESPFALQIAPMMILGPRWNARVIHFRLNPNRPASAGLAQVERIIRKYNPLYPFEYHFVDEAYDQKFKAEKQIGRLAGLFAGLTIFISCLGLFALATYMAASRIREIGIRKVLGASATGIAALLAKDFIRLVLIAFVIAAPIARIIMNKWLLNYGYRITIGWDIFAWSGLLALLIATGAVSYQSIRAALANPVDSLRAD